MESYPTRVSKDAGFTLIEVLIALVLTGVIIATFAGTMVQAVYTQQQLFGRVTALVMGEGKLAELIQGSEPASSGDFPAPYQSYHWFSKEETTDDDIRIIQLTVYWQDQRGAQRRLNLQGYPSK